MTAHAPRFDMDAPDLMGVSRYFERRAVQGLMDGYTWTGLITPLTDERGAVWGARTTCHDPEGTLRQSVYVVASHRGQGHLSRYLEATDLPFVTGPDCDLEAFFTKRGCPTPSRGASPRRESTAPSSDTTAPAMRPGAASTT